MRTLERRKRSRSQKLSPGSPGQQRSFRSGMAVGDSPRSIGVESGRSSNRLKLGSRRRTLKRSSNGGRGLLAEYLEKNLLDRQRSLVDESIRLKAEGDALLAERASDDIDIAGVVIDLNQTYQRHLLLTRELEQIRLTLDRVRSGAFGRCEECEGTIDRKRLRANPAARLCLGCQEEWEASRMRGSVNRSVAWVRPAPDWITG